MALTDLQRKKLIDGVNVLPLPTIEKYFLEGEITFDDVPQINAERKQYLEKRLNSLPNPNEQKEWQTIAALFATPDNDVLNRLRIYISNWENKRPVGNHVDEARLKYNEIENHLKAESERLEREDWEKLNLFSKTELIAYLQKYPNTAHKQDIDNAYWELVDKENVVELQEYKTIFPQGIHITESNNLLNAIVEWNNIKNTNDLFTIHNYKKNNPKTPFMQQVELLLMRLKQEEMQMMRDNSNEYDVQKFFKLINEGVITEYELIAGKVATPNIIDTLKNTDVRSDLPDIKKAIEDSAAECKPGYTDVYFFGVPSTGKTCVLMGLSRSSSLRIDLSSSGGDYAEALQQYTDVGITVPRTPGTFVSTLDAKISSKVNPDAVHHINLVEMSGEEFAFDIAKNEDHITSFEKMGSGATELLKNDNRKVFFLIIDPTTNIVRISREKEIGKDAEGKPITELEYCIVNQRTILQKMVNLMESPQNREIMRKVDSIHIIMTKADTLGNAVEREDKALKIFQDKYSGDILEAMVDLCKEHNINAQSNFHPKLYTFSLGSFYIGGLYEYEPTDSNRLVKAIRNSTRGHKKKSWWDRIKETVN